MTVHIGISGPIAAGKSTLARGLADIFDLMGKKTHIIPFATGLKYLATLYNNPMGYKKAYDYFIDLGYTDEQSLIGTKMLIEGFIKYPIVDGVKPRKLMQFIGTEVGRDTLDKNIWLKDVQQKITSDPVDFVISDDMRFVNESAAVHIRVAITLEGYEDIYAIRKRMYPEEYFFNDHQSEQESSLLYHPDFTIGLNSKVSDVITLARNILLHVSTWSMPIPHVTYTHLLTSGTPMDLPLEVNHDYASIRAFDKDRFVHRNTVKISDYTGE